MAKTEEEKKAIQEETRKDRVDFFRPTYKQILNRCITERYREKDFRIVYALLDNESLADIIEKQPSDRVVFVGMDAKTHRTKRPDGTFPYPDQEYILNQLLPLDRLVIGGFHMWDCVDKLAKTAYEAEISVLVDEDLTEFFAHRLRDKDFRTDKYPTYNARKHQKGMFRAFMNARKSRPWLWQEY